MAYNVTAGFAGMFSLAHAGFIGIGAYVSSLLLLRLNVPFPLALLAAMAASAFLGSLLASIVERLRGDTFAVLTLWFAFVVTLIATNWVSVTRGAYGLAGIPRPDGFETAAAYFFLCVFLLLLSYAVLHQVTTSPFGRAMAVCRDDEEASLALGKNVWKVRVIAFVIASAFAGLSGALLASFIRFINPASFGIPLLAQLLTYLVIGGLASLRGSLLGVLLLIAVREALRFLSIDPELVGALREMLLALILIVVVMYRPRGIAGRVDLD